MKALSFGKYKRGVATLEILIAFTILMLSLTAVILVVFGNQSISIDTQTNSEAVSKAQAVMEIARALSRQDFNAVTSIAATPDDIYQKSLNVVSVDASTKQVTAIVSWISMGRSLSVRQTTLFTNPTAGNTCSATLSGDWTNPQHYDFSTTDLISPASGNNSNGLSISDVKAYRQKLYMIAATTGNFKNTFYIFDLPANPSQMPTYLGSMDNAAATDDGLSALAVFGNYAYVANAHDANFQTCSQSSTCAQLQIIDITNSSAPAVKKSYKVPSALAPFVLGNMTSTGQAVGKSIFYSSGYVYLGLTKTASGPEFNIIDVHDPLNPFWVGSYAVGRTVNSIYVKNNYAYLMTDDNARELLTLDISNKSNPTAVGLFNAPGSSGFGYGTSVALLGTKLYIGRSYVSNAPEFYILDNTNPASTLSSLGSKDIGTSANNDSVNTLTVREYLAFILTNKEFQIWNVSNPAAIASYAVIPLGNFTNGAGTGSGTTLSCTGNYFYVALTSPQGNSKDVFSVITPYIPNSYALSNTGDVAVVQGTSGSNTITRTVVSGFPPADNLSATGLPAGAAVVFANNGCTPTCSGTLTIITTYPTTPVGTYPITVKNSAGTVTTAFNLVVSAQPFIYSLTNSGIITTTQGASGNNTITRTLTSGATQPVALAASGLPAGATAAFANNSCNPTCSGTLTITTLATTPTGTYPVTVTGTGGKTTTFNLVVVTPFDYTLSNNAPTPAGVTVARKSSVSVVFTRTLVSGAPTPISLSVTAGSPSIPSQTDFTFVAPTSCSPTCATTLTISPKQSATTGVYTITVTGSPGDMGSRTTTFKLTITN